MAIKLTGLASGLDTETMIKELMNAHSLGKVKVENKKTTLSWKEDKWKELNTKLYKLYTEQISKMRLQGSYSTKEVSSTDESKITATSSTGAPIGTQVIEIQSLASSQYITGGKLTGVTADTKLAEMWPAMKNNEIKVQNGDEIKTIRVTEDTTVNNFVELCTSAGLNASFDAGQGRFFISSKESGEENKFSITSGQLTTEAVNLRNDMETLVNYNSLSSVDKESFNTALYTLSSTTATAEDKSKAEESIINLAKEAITNTTTNVVKSNLLEVNKSNVRTDKELMNVIESKIVETKTAEITEKVKKDLGKGATEEKIKEKVQEQIETDEFKNEVEKLVTDEVSKRAYSKLADQSKLIDSFVKDGMSMDTMKSNLSELGITAEELGKLTITDTKPINNQITEIVGDGTTGITGLMKQYASAPTTIGATSSVLSNLGLGNIVDGKVQSGASSEMIVVEAKDASMILNGAKLTGSSNTMTVNGVTYELKGETAGEKVTLNVSDNTKATYDTIKDFVTDYNKILKEMNTLYYAPSSRGYDPLTDEEKESMTDTQIELWENKIKDSLLRRDDQLGSIITSVKSAMQTSVEVDGKSYSLSDFGICTSTDYTEKGLLHIYGDSEDPVYANKTDKLMELLNEDPEVVMEVLSGVANKLYETMQDKMKATPMSSALTFYNDKQIKTQQTHYKDEIAKLEERLQRIENRYNAQFAAMESAMASLNSQSSYLSGLFGA